MKFALLMVALVHCSFSERKARAVLLKNPDTTTESRPVWGAVDFTQSNSQSVLKIDIQLTDASGLTDGKHGFHIHELGNIFTGCGDAGGHYNPHSKTHGGINDTERHIGDFGNIEIKTNMFTGSFSDKKATLFGQYTIVGRAVVLHSGEDDLGKGVGNKAAESKKTGNAGKRVACGVIAVNSNGFDSKASRFTTTNSIIIIIIQGIYYILVRFE